MAKLTISDTARGCRVARSTLQRAIQTGRLSLDADHRIDTAELLRAGYTLHAALQGETRRTPHAALQDTAPRSSNPLQDAAAPSATEPLAMQLSTALERENTLLRAALDAAAAREQAAQERERDYREHIARLTAMLGQAHQQNQRLLDLPRTSPSLRPQDAPGATQAPRRAQREQAHRTRRQATPVVPCAGASWPYSRSIRRGSRPPRCGRCSAWRGAWPIRVWGCCGMGWCSGWDGGDMCQHSHHKPTDHKDIIMTLFVGNSACTEDQRADTLTYCLAILTQSVSLALVHLEALLQEPDAPDRERRLGAILSALERVNTKAMQLGLGKGLEGISDEKQRLETLVAQQQQESKA